MRESNNIDRLFQEKFKDFEVTPSDCVWENIRLKKNNKKKETDFHILWLRLCGFLAVFLIGFSFTTTIISEPFGLENTLNSAKESNALSGYKNNVPGKVSDQNKITKQHLLEKTKQTYNVSNVNNSKDGNGNLNSVVHNDQTHTETAPSLKNVFSDYTTNNNKNQINSKKTESTNRKNTNSIKSTTILSSYNNSNQNTTVASKASEATLNTTNIINLIKSGVNATSLITNTDAVAITETEQKLPENSKITEYDTYFDANFSNSKVAYESGYKHIPAKGHQTTVLNTPEKTETIPSNTKSVVVFDIEKMSVNYKKTTSTAINQAISVITDSLTTYKKEIEKTNEKEITNEKTASVKKEKKSKWLVSSSFSPVYMNGNGSESALDTKFSGNTKSYQTSTTYGIGLKFAINNKWSARTGLNILNFDYNTNGITYYNSSNGAGLENVSENGIGTAIVIENQNQDQIAYDTNGNVTERHSGNINHRINYIEVPMELSCKIVNKKFGIDVIGGVSTIFLKDNRVSLINSESNLTIGEANNLNKLHYSTNIGLGLRYSFMKKLQANLEPMLKYQINTYKGNAGNLKPYFIGIYSGISFSF